VLANLIGTTYGATVTKLIPLLLAATFAASAATVDARASALAGFHTPAWAAQCVVAENVLGGSSPLYCWTPNDGFTVRMYPGGKVTKSYEKANVGSNDRFFAKRLVGFGQHWAFRIAYVGSVYRCSSKATGLTCWNQAGHGWWLGRYRGYRIF